ncbi:MAG: DNA-binding IclR family transcriptional regulator, partial [Phenylobacterium sp.]
MFFALKMAVKMTKHDRKLAVLNAFRTFSEPVSLSELMVILGEDYAQRTIRRWLVDFEHQGLVE